MASFMHHAMNRHTMMIFLVLHEGIINSDIVVFHEQYEAQKLLLKPQF
jgi:hypothetical protein